MSELTTRLREIGEIAANDLSAAIDVADEAADEITRLRAEVERLTKERDRHEERIVDLAAHNGRLKADLEKVEESARYAEKSRDEAVAELNKALETLGQLRGDLHKAEKERDSFRRTLDERWEADKKAFAAIMRAAGRTHGVPPNKEVVAYFVEQNEALTARLRSMCEAMEPFAKAASRSDVPEFVLIPDGHALLFRPGSNGPVVAITEGDLRRACVELDAAKKELDNPD